MTRARRKAAGFAKRERELEKHHAATEEQAPSEASLVALERKRALKMKKLKDSKKNPASIQVDTLQCLDTTKQNLYQLAKIVKVPPSDKRDILIRKLARSVCERPNIDMDLVRKDFENGKKWWEQYTVEKAAICKRFGHRPEEIPDLCSFIVEGGAKRVAQALESISIYGLARRAGSTDIKKNKFEFIAKIMDFYCPDGPPKLAIPPVLSTSKVTANAMSDDTTSVTPSNPTDPSVPVDPSAPVDPSIPSEPSTTVPSVPTSPSGTGPSAPEKPFSSSPSIPEKPSDAEGAGPSAPHMPSGHGPSVPSLPSGSVPSVPSVPGHSGSAMRT